MSSQVKIIDRLEFRGGATHRQNIKGPIQPEMVHFHDHFTDDTLSTDSWLVTVTNGTVAVDHGTYAGGQALFTTAASQDGEVSFLATPLCWEDDLNAVAETKILITDVSGVAVFFGFSDKTFETSPAMPIDYDGGVLATVSGRDAVGFICDADDTVNGVSSIVAVGANAGTLETAIDSATDWADGKWYTLRVELNKDGDAEFFLDGSRIGFMETAITSGTKMCIIIAVANRDAGADTVYVDRVDGWEDEEINT